MLKAILFDMDGTIIHSTKIWDDIRSADESNRIHIATAIIESATINFLEGFLDFYKTLKKQNVFTGLATNSPNYALTLFNRKLQLSELFDNHIYNSCHVSGKMKPDPAVILYALKAMKVLPHQCIMFEDSRDGIIAAQKAGIKRIIGVNSQKNKEELSGANLIIENYNQISLQSLLDKFYLYSNAL